MSLPYYPTLSTIPDFGTDPMRAVIFPQDAQNVSQAPRVILFPQDQADHLLTFNFTLHTAGEIRQFQSFFRNQGGATRAFWMPTWCQEIDWVDTTLGSLKVSAGSDYAETHIDDMPQDHYGRQIFAWHPDHGLETSRIIRVVENGDGTETLDLEFPLSFLPDYKTIVGWCHLMRFTEQELEWKYLHPTCAQIQIRFRSARASNNIEQTNDLTHVGYGDITLPFASVAQTVAATDPPNQRTAYAIGPINLHYPDGAEYQTRWAAWISPLGKLRLKKLPTGYIWLPDDTGADSGLFPTTIPLTTDHISLAFDQNGYEVIAYQTDPDEIEVRRFVSTVLDITTFAGSDPLVIWNWTLDPNAAVGDSDVVVYYLNTLGQLALRVQRDNFAVEYVLGELPFVPLALRRTYYADIDVSGTDRRFLYLEALDAGWRNATLISDPYPEPPGPPPPPPEVEALVGDSGLSGLSVPTGDYDIAVVYADGLSYETTPHPAFEDAGRATLSNAGEYGPIVVYSDGLGIYDDHPAHADAARGSVTFSTGTYSLVVITEEAPGDTARAALTTGAASYTLSAIETTPLADTARGSLTHTAIYEPA